MVLDADPIYLSKGSHEGESKKISLHENFADLAQCAECQCEFCRFIRRQFHYNSWDGAIYQFPEELLGASNETALVSVSGRLEDGVITTVWT